MIVSVFWVVFGWFFLWLNWFESGVYWACSWLFSLSVLNGVLMFFSNDVGRVIVFVFVF